MTRRLVREIEKLYRSGLSQAEVAQQLGLGYKQIQYAMERNGLKRRTRSEATYRRRNPFGDPFHIKQNLNANDYFLKGLGLGLYWGEGNRKNKNSIRLGNTDPRLIQKFVEFLVQICGARRRKFRFGIQIFGDHDPYAATKWWIKKLGFEKSYFQKPVVTKKRGKGTYKKWNNKGVVTVYFHNSKLRNYIIQCISKL